MTDQEHERLQLAADAWAARAVMLVAAGVVRDGFPESDAQRQQELQRIEAVVLLASADIPLLPLEGPAPADQTEWENLLRDSLDRLAQEFLDALRRGRLQ